MRAIRSRLPGILLALAALFLLLRFVHLEYDTPLFFANYGQSEITDPYMYSSFARNAELYNDWDPYRYDRWTSWRVSLSSGTSRVLFGLAGVSRWNANLGAVILQSLGLLLFLLGWRRWRPPLETALTALFMSCSILLFSASRAPFLENGALFAFGGAYFLYSRYRRGGVVGSVVGALLAVATFSGKLTAATLLVPFIVDGALFESKRVRNIGALLGGFGAVAMIYWALFYAEIPGGMIGYYRSHLASVALPTHWTDSPLVWVKTLLSYGASGGLTRFQPLSVGLGIFGVVVLVSQLRRIGIRDEGVRAPLFAAVMLVAGVAPLVPVDYQPYRYFVPLLPALLALAAYGIASVSHRELTLTLRGKRWALQFIALLVAMVYMGAQIYLFAENLGKDSLNWASLSVELTILFVVTAVLVLLPFRLWAISLSRKIGAYFAVITCAMFVVFQADLIYRALTEPRHPLMQQSSDLEGLLAPRALVAGNYAPQVTIDNSVANLIYPFGVSHQEPDIFKRFPITHVAVAPPTLTSAKGLFPELRRAREVVRFWARGGSFVIYRVNSSNAGLSNFERAVSYKQEGQFDSALAYFRKVERALSENLTVKLSIAETLALAGQFDEAERLAGALSEKYESLYYAHYLLGRVYFAMSDKGREPTYVRKTIGEFRRAEELNSAFSKTMDLPAQIRQLEVQLSRLH